MAAHPIGDASSLFGLATVRVCAALTSLKSF
jgi:hypothetical protein